MSKRRLSPLTLRQIRKSKLRLVESLKHYEDKDSYDLTDYYFEKGLRKVYPYYFTFRSFAKGRWVSEKVLDVLTREFRSETVLDHARAIKQGRVTINGESIDEEYRFKNNDLLMSRVHRHELPVSDQKISIVHENDDMLVINKPASIPIHPAGRFRYNSLMFILAKEMNLKKLFSIHRLDRLTSGILLIGKNSHISKKIGDEIRAGLVKKVYLAVVDGEFPEGKTCCSQKINVMCPVIGLHCVDNSEEGAVCTTNFNRIFYDSSCNRSVIACYPETGRTHQIRIHSQFLGHPIVQDPLYNSDAWGSEKGKGGIDVNSRESIVRHLRELHANATREGNWRFRDQYLIDDNKIHKEKYTCEPNLQDCDDNEHKTVHKYYDASCPECQVKFRDPTFEEMEIFLHAYIYSGQSWSFKAPLPHWMEKYKQYLTEDLL